MRHDPQPQPGASVGGCAKMILVGTRVSLTLCVGRTLLYCLYPYIPGFSRVARVIRSSQALSSASGHWGRVSRLPLPGDNWQLYKCNLFDPNHRDRLTFSPLEYEIRDQIAL